MKRQLPLYGGRCHGGPWHCEMPLSRTISTTYAGAPNPSAYAVTHWLVFPNDDRLRLAAYLVVLILLVRTLAGAATRRMPGDAVRLSAPRSLRLTGLPRLEALLGRRAGPGA